MKEYRDDFKRVEKDAYWSLPRVFLYVAAILLGAYVIGFLATGGDLAIYSFWGVKRANVERKIFKESQSHVEGTISYLSRLEREYKDPNTSQAQKEALRGLIVEESRKVDFDQLPSDLQLFVNSVR